MRKLTRSILASTAVVGLLALPVAGASANDSTLVTFAVENGGGISIADDGSPVDVSATPVDTAVDGSLDIALNTLTVTDATNPFNGGWEVTVQATSFSDGGSNTIAGEKVTYASGAATPELGSVVVPVGQQLTLADAELAGVTLDANRTAVSATGATGNNSATFTPQIRVDLTGAAAATYSGTIVHSVTGS